MTHKNPWFVLLALAATLLCGAATLRAEDAAPAAPTGKSVLLKAVFVPGDYLVTRKTAMRQKVTVDGVEQPTQTMQATITMRQTVGQPSAKGVQSIGIRFQRVQLHTTVGSREISYDTDGPDSKAQEALAAVYRTLLAAKASLTVNADGDVVAASGLSAIWDELAAKTPRMTPLANQMKAQMGDAFIRELFASVALDLPDKPVALNGEWRRDSKMTLPFLGVADFKSTSRLKAIEQTPAGKVAVINIAGTIRTTEKNKTELRGVRMIFTKVDLTQTTKLRLNTTNTLLHNVNLVQEGTMEGKVFASRRDKGKAADRDSTTDAGEDTDEEEGETIVVNQKVTVSVTSKPSPPATTQPAENKSTERPTEADQT